MTTDEYKYIRNLRKYKNSIALKSRGLCNNQGIVRVTTDSYDNNLFQYVAAALGGCTVDDRGARKISNQN